MAQTGQAHCTQQKKRVPTAKRKAGSIPAALRPAGGTCTRRTRVRPGNSYVQIGVYGDSCKTHNAPPAQRIARRDGGRGIGKNPPAAVRYLSVRAAGPFWRDPAAPAAWASCRRCWHGDADYPLTVKCDSHKKKGAGAIRLGLFGFSPKTPSTRYPPQMFCNPQSQSRRLSSGSFPCRFIGSPSIRASDVLAGDVARLRIGSAVQPLLFEPVQAKPPRRFGDGSRPSVCSALPRTGPRSDTIAGRQQPKRFRRDTWMVARRIMLQRIC